MEIRGESAEVEILYSEESLDRWEDREILYILRDTA